MNTSRLRKHGLLALLVCATPVALAVCAKQNAEVQLLPETREGMFYLNFAEAQGVAQSEGKHLLVDFWRPG